DEFCEQLELMRSCPWLTVGQVQTSLKENSNDAAMARLSLSGVVGQRAPHEKGIPSDAHIAGLIGCRAPVRRPRLTSATASGKAARPDTPRPFAPMTRPIRFANAKGETNFYFGVERITKADTLPSRSVGRASSQRGDVQRRP